MKTLSKITIVALLILYSTTSGAQATRRFYNENEVVLPNFLQYDIDKMQETTILGTMDKNVINLSWKTKAETNTSHFELQRSSNGVDYEPIETLTASGISKTSTGTQQRILNTVLEEAGCITVLKLFL